MKIKSSKKEILLDYLIPLVLEYVIIGVLIAIFTFSVNLGPLIQESKMVGDELAKPTLGRLIYGVFAFIMFIVLVYFASKFSKKEKDTPAFWLGYTAGIFLWQSVGEISWHFSVDGVNFAPLENITSFPMVILICMLFVYCRINHSFDWGVLITYLSFICNWFGHYVTIGIYPIFSKFFDRHTWIITMSLIVGTFSFVLSLIFLLFKVKTKRGRNLASLYTFISTGVIAFSFLEG